MFRVFSSKPITNLGSILKPRLRNGSVFETASNKRYTFSDLDQLSRQVISILKLHQIGPGDRVAIVGLNGARYISIYLGVMRYGAVAILISPKQPDSVLTSVLNDSNSKLLFSDRPMTAPIPAINFSEIDRPPPTASFQEFVPSDTSPALVIFTSGSTVRPKGVVISHKSHLWILNKKAGAKSGKNRILVAGPMYHMSALTQIEVSLLKGVNLVLMPAFDANSFLDAIEQHSIEAFTVVPSMIALAMDALKKRPSTDLSSIKHIGLSSAPVSTSLFLKVKKCFPNATVSIGYGLTEAGPGMFGRHSRKPTPEMSVGCQIPGIDYRLVNGALEIRSPSMLSRYEDFSRDRFTKDGYFVTQDLFRVDSDGFYYFMGRADDMFVCGGKKIYPRRVESLLEHYPAVQYAAVVGIEDEIKGMKPYAFVCTDGEVVENDLKKYLLERVEPYEVPRSIWRLETMPLNEIHKVHRQELRKVARDNLTKKKR